MKQWIIQFVSGITWQVKEAEPLPADKTGWWRVQRLDIVSFLGSQPEYKSMGFWLVNIDNVEAVKEA